jgi:hypothetical protein
MADDTLFVIQTVSNGPSEKVGILAGDRIVTVNDTAIAGVKMERDEIMKRLRGPKGSVVQLGVVRRGYDEQLVFRVTRDKIPVYTLDAAYMIAPKVGYIKRECSADFDADKEQIMTAFTVSGYELMEQRENEMRFRASNFFRRVRLLFEDEVVVRRSEGGGVEIEGVRRTVAYAMMRLNSYLVHKRDE